MVSRKHKDYTGRRFGRLVVIKRLGLVKQSNNPKSYNISLYECKCDCGNIVQLHGNRFSNGHTKSCGCLKSHKKHLNASTRGQRHFLRLARHRAKKQGLPFNLTVDDITIPEYCPILGIKLESGIGKGLLRADNIASLDKFTPEKGYVRGNVWVISWRANRLKSDATLEELENIVSALKKRAA